MNGDEHTEREAPIPADEYQQAWRAQSDQTRITVDANLLQQEVRRNQKSFQAIILRRDVIEVGIAVLLLPYWIYQGLASSLPWSWYLMIPALIWIIGFFLLDRTRHPQTPTEPGESLVKCARDSLAQMEHQIWLLRNVFWWYLLPFTIAILAFFAHLVWRSSRDWLDALGHGFIFGLLFAIYYFVYWLNQRVIDSDLGPRRQELLALLTRLDDERSDDSATTDPFESTKNQNKLWQGLLGVSVCGLAIMLPAVVDLAMQRKFDKPARSSGPNGDWLEKVVTDHRKEWDLVGLAAMVMVDGQIEAAAVHGERKYGTNVSLELDDRWHLGGIAKSITATMIARLVEAGQIQWTDTVGNSFSDDAIHEDWKPVTIQQLLTDTAGAPAYFPSGIQRQRPERGSKLVAARRQVVLDLLGDKPDYPPGTKHRYSNVGYTIAAAMVEQSTGASWEDLVQREVFDPLGLSDSGFGPPESNDHTLQQPRGHRTGLAGKSAVDDKDDNTPIMGPSAGIHMTLKDLCTFAQEHLRGEQGSSELLSSETYKLLHTPALRRYAFGWLVRESTYTDPHKQYWHNGSNTMWYALAVWVPSKNMVVAVTANEGDSTRAESAAFRIEQAASERFGTENDNQLRTALPTSAYPKRSPFSAVRWRESQPEVQVRETWYKLTAIDDVPITKIVSFSQTTFGNRWQQRFEEDLVEVLSRMGYPPSYSVNLNVESMTNSETQVLKYILMTGTNRNAIKAAAEARRSESARSSQ